MCMELSYTISQLVLIQVTWCSMTGLLACCECTFYLPDYFDYMVVHPFAVAVWLSESCDVTLLTKASVVGQPEWC